MKLLAAALTLLASPALAQDYFADHISVTSIGIACEMEPVALEEAPNTASGDIYIIDGLPEVISDSRIVPTAPGLAFGFIFETPVAIPVVEARIFHPEFPGHGLTSQHFITSYTPDNPEFRFYQFDFGYELQPGDWVMEAYAEGKLLYRLEWTMIEATPNNPIVQACGFEDLLG